jgi:ubiquitin-activating enzyme E1
LELCDWEKFGRPEELHITLIALYKFYEHNKRLPNLNDVADAEKLVELTVEVNEENKKKMDAEGIIKLEEVNKTVAKNVALFANTAISPITSFWGGIIA